MGLSQLFGNWELAGYAKPILTETFSPERTRVLVSLVAEKVAETGVKVAETGIKVAERLSEMDALQAREVIRRIGPDRGGVWELL